VISSRVMLRLALGILCGVVLVLIPSVFTAPTPTESTGTWNPVLVQRSNQPTAQPLPLLGLSPVDLEGLSFLIVVVFIFLPSAMLSLVVRRWAAKRARDYL
jgi:hypothetical protein